MKRILMAMGVTSGGAFGARLMPLGALRRSRRMRNVSDKERDGEGDDEKELLPVWPSAAYAEACRHGEWAEFEVKAIDLYEFLETMLPKLEARGVGVAVFPTPEGKGVVPSIEELRDAIDAELTKYELIESAPVREAADGVDVLGDRGADGVLFRDLKRASLVPRSELRRDHVDARRPDRADPSRRDVRFPV